MDKEYSVCLDIVIEHLTELKLGGMVGTVREAKETIIKLEQELLQLSAKQTTTPQSTAPEKVAQIAGEMEDFVLFGEIDTSLDNIRDWARQLRTL